MGNVTHCLRPEPEGVEEYKEEKPEPKTYPHPIDGAHSHNEKLGKLEVRRWARMGKRMSPRAQCCDDQVASRLRITGVLSKHETFWQVHLL